MNLQSKPWGWQILVAFLLVTSFPHLSFGQKQEPPEDFEKEQSFLRQRMEWFYNQRRFPLDHIPSGARLKAVRQSNLKVAAEFAAKNRLPRGPLGPLGPTSPQWQLIGPQPDNGFWGPNAGRVTSLAIDPRNSNVVYLGGAEGGVWKTTDGGTTWTPLGDTQASLAVGSIALDPSNPDTVYVGTGEQNGSIDSYYGAGVLKSTNGGATWTQYVSTFGGGQCGGAWIGSIAVHPTNSQVALAGVAQCFADGVYRSADGGQTWAAVLAPPSGGAVTDVIFDPTNGNIAYASSSGHGIYKSTDAGQTWSTDNGTGVNVLPTANVGRIALVMALSSTSTLYAGIANSADSTLLGLFKTVDGGANWTQLTSTPNYCGGQCWYDNVVGVDPVNANVVYAGGQFSTPLIRSLDGGTTWASDSSIWNGLHPDTHALAFFPDGSKLYTGNDGGAWSTTNVTSNTLTWTDLNNALAITEFYPGLSIDPSNVLNSYIGTQDNSLEHYTGSLTWKSVDCGDGGATAIDFVTPTTVYTNCIGLSLDKSTDGGSTFISARNGFNTSDRTNWTPPLTMDPANSQTLYFGTYRVYQTINGAGLWTAISPDLTAGTGVLSAIAVAPTDSNTVYSGSGDSHVNVTTNASAGVGAVWTDRSAGLPGRYITAIAGDHTASTTAYVTFSGFTGFGDSLGHVFSTTNGGATWTDISGDLPNTPVNTIVVDPDVAGTIFIGTDIGTFYTSSGGTSWSALGAGLPNVVVSGLALHNATRTLRASTHGRSVWDLNVSSLLPVPSIASISPSSALLGSAAFTLTVNGFQFDSTSVVQWNGTGLSTSFVSSSQVTASVPASDLTVAGTAQITVFNTSSGKLSNPATFTINNPAPSLTSISPTSTVAGGAAFILTANGTNFVSTSAVQWNGSSRGTTFVSGTQLTASITAGDIANAGTAQVNVINPGPGGGQSNAQPFTINNPVPAITTLAPSSTLAGGAALRANVNGSNFVSTSVVQWNGSNRATTFVSSTLLKVSILAFDIAHAGTVVVTVFNPTPGGGTSGAATFTIKNPVPGLTSIAPNNATTGGGAFTLVVTGSKFVSTSAVQWNGLALITTFTNSTTLKASVPAGDITLGGTAKVTVFSPAPGGGTSGSQTFTINNPAPVLASLSPNNTLAGGAAFTLTLNGSKFVPNSVAKWNGLSRTTTFVSAVKLNAAIPATDILKAGTAQVTVFSPTPAGGTSSPVTFTIKNPLPALTSILPTSAIAGGAAFSLAVTGSNFVASSVVNWNGAARTTTFVSGTQLKASISASDIAAAATVKVTVVNPAPGGGTSASQNFTVDNPAPTLTSLSPNSALAGGAAFTLTVNGSKFVSTSAVRWNNTSLATTFVSATQIIAAVSASNIANAGTVSVTVLNPAPGGGTSNALIFTINNPLPALTSLSPNSATAKGPAFTVTVNGSNFVSTSTVQWNGANLATTFVSAIQVTATVSAGDISKTGTAQVTVVNKTPGGGTSNTLTFTINP